MAAPATSPHARIASSKRSASLFDALDTDFHHQAPYAVALAYRIRFVMQLNARSAMHMLELRTTPQGHPAYRWVAQQMHERIAQEAGHHAVAELMAYVDHEPEPELERLDAERRAGHWATAAEATEAAKSMSGPTEGESE